MKYTQTGSVQWSSMMANDPGLRDYRECEPRTIFAALERANPPRGQKLYFRPTTKNTETPESLEVNTAPLWVDEKLFSPPPAGLLPGEIPS